MPSAADVAAYTKIAARVILACKKIQPSFYSPENSPGLPAAWGYVLACNPLPERIYLEAVAAFYADTPGGERPGVGDIVKYARVVRDRWETDPNYRPILRAHREAREAERDRQIAAGTFRGSRAIGPPPDLREYGIDLAAIESNRGLSRAVDEVSEGIGDLPW